MREFSKQEIGLIKSIKRYVGSDLKKIKKNKETIENLLKENEELESKNRVWDDTVKATFGYSLEECIASLNTDVDADDAVEDNADDTQESASEESVVDETPQEEAAEAQFQDAEPLVETPSDDDDSLPFDAGTNIETEAEATPDSPDADAEWNGLNADSIFNN